jgi:DNA-binding SARP family transcriptional activator
LARVEFGVLGPLEVRVDGEPARLTGVRQRALLAILLLNANRVVPADQLLDTIWDERPPASGRHALQVLVAEVRKALEPGRGKNHPSVLATDQAGYRIHVEPGALDLDRFESLVERGRRSLAERRVGEAAELFRAGLDLWRGPALADLAYEPFAQVPIARLEELRRAAVEARIDAELASGRHRELVAELEALVREHPLRERLRGQLMLALYRSGRQAEALDAYQDARRVLVDELGIDPGPELQQLEREILNQAPSLLLETRLAESPRARAGTRRSILLASETEEELDDLLPIATCLAVSSQPHELILLRTVDPVSAGAEAAVAAATRQLGAVRTRLAEQSVGARVAVFTSRTVARDTLRLVAEQDVHLVLGRCPPAMLDGREPPAELAGVLSESLADVALLAARGSPPELGPGGRVVTPFVGADHDWASLELAAWIASAARATLTIVGTAGDEDAGRRDASRLVAVASLAVQELADVLAEPVLADPTPDALAAAAEGAALIVLPFPSDWQRRGLGASRLAVATRSQAPALLVRAGARPGGLTPPEGLTRYTWSLAAGASS